MWGPAGARMILMKRISEKIYSPFKSGKHYYAERRSGRGLVICLAMVCLAGWGCSSSQPPEANILQIDSMDRPPKPPDCSLPILHSELLASGYRRVAIVEAWGKSDQENAVLDAVRRGACEIGADALLIVSSQSQVDGRISTEGIPKTSDAAESDSSSRVHSYEEGLAPGIGEPGHAGYYIDAVALIHKSL